MTDTHHPRNDRALRRCAAAGALAATLAISGCAANFGAETGRVYDPAAGVSYRSGDVYLLDAVLVVDGQGYGTLSGTLTSQASTDDALTGIKVTTKTKAAATVTIKGGSVALPAGGAVQLLTGHLVRFNAPSLQPGYFVTLEFSFQNAGSFSLKVPILPNSADFSSVSVPTGSAS